ncbi:MAG: HAMP domain-containing protein [Rhodocyclaceae bacterium]|nr:HAMP domain-containing protein [Rhodocyclaceae bacterium]
MIRRWGIRARLTLVTLLPLSILAVALIAFFTGARINEIEQAHLARGQALARQMAVASEFGVFAGNGEQLQRLANAVAREDDVLGVIVMDRESLLLAASGEYPAPDASQLTAPGSTRREDRYRIIEPVLANQLGVTDELSEILAPSPGDAPRNLGVVVLDISRENLIRRSHELVGHGFLLFALVLVGGMVLARRISASVSGPIREVSAAVTRIGHGDFAERVPETGGGSLARLATGVNDMASRLQEAYRTMENRVDEATEELRNRTDDAERANLAKSRFLAAASHDLRQPMHALVLFISELSSLEHPPRTSRLVRQIAASAEAMETLLDSLLDISKLDAGVLQPEIRAFPLLQVLRRIQDDFTQLASDKGLRLRVRPSEAWTRSDPVLLERVLANLVANAIRYTPMGTVAVHCRRDTAGWRVEVRDSGIGIPKEAQEQIFQEFVQLDNPERARHKGLGLGLAIVRRLTDLLDHPLSLRSAHGRGSVFSLRLPRAEPVELAPGEERGRLPGSLEGLILAVVDDDELALAGIVSLLTSWGCEVVSGENLERLRMALALGGRAPQAIISDYRLRGPHDGIDVVHLVRRRYGAELPAMIVTGDTGPETLQLAQHEGIALLHKPVRPAKLRALLQRQLNATPETH